jgi:hypothetical protein
MPVILLWGIPTLIVFAGGGTLRLETVIEGLLTGQYRNPIRVVAFNT